MKNVILISLFMMILSCSYSVYSSGLPHLKTINVSAFKNNSTEYNLEEKIFINLNEKFSADGRLSLVNVSPDCILDGEILDYSNEIRTFAGATVDQYQVRILFKITFTDLVRNKVIWQNNSLLLSEIYSSQDSNILYKSEEEAQNKIITDLFETILKNSLEEW